jgi:hypothetical protein
MYNTEKRRNGVRPIPREKRKEKRKEKRFEK